MQQKGSKSSSGKGGTGHLQASKPLPLSTPGLELLPELKLPPKEPPEEVIVVAYGRYSSDMQSSGSADAQIRMIEEAARAGRLPLGNPKLRGRPVKLVGYVKDEAVSGTKTGREGIQLVERLIKGRQVHAVAFMDLSRSTRVLQQAIVYRELARFHCVELVSLAENTSSYDDSTKATYLMHGFLAEMTNDQRRAATVSHMSVRVADGFSHGSLPYGYTSAPSRVENRKGREVASHFVLAVQPERAAVVQRIFQMYADGMGYKKIASQLNAETLPAPGVGHRGEGWVGGWGPSTIGHILKNPRYAGLWHWKQTTMVKDPTRGKRVQRPVLREEWVGMGSQDGVREDLRIIPGALWEAVQARLADVTLRRQRGATEAEQRWGNRKTSEADHLLSGLLQCGVCGGRFILTSGRRGGYYGCYNAHRKGMCACRRHVQRRKLEAAVVGVVAKLLDDAKLASEIAKRANAKLRKHLADDPNAVERLEAERVKLDRQIDRMVVYIAQNDDSNAVASRLQDLEARKRQVTGQMAQLKAVRRDPILLTPHAVREKLRGLVALLNTEPGRARKILSDVLQGYVVVAVNGDEVRVQGSIHARVDGSGGKPTPFDVVV